MNFEELNTVLYAYTTSEKGYLVNPTLSKFYQYSKMTEIDGRPIYKFEDTAFQFGENKNFFIQKHTRFIHVPEHMHEYIEINYVYSGQCIQQINGKTVRLNQGDLIIIDTEIPHAIEKTEENDIIINLLINQRFFTEIFFNSIHKQSPLTNFLLQAISDSQHHNQYLLYRSHENEKLHLLIQQLLCEHYDSSFVSEEIKKNIIQLIFLELIRTFSVEVNGTSENSTNQQLRLDILSYIEINFSTITLHSCAQHFGYNATYFSSLIKECTGFSFMQLLQNYRLAASLIPLLHSTSPIKDIALEAGFSNLNQYYKIFTQKYHMTPAKYRKIKKD